jgi:DNA gyrase subunit A
LIPKRLLEESQSENGAFLTHVQAEAIGNLRLIQLTGLEIETLSAELQKLHDEIENFESILSDRERVRTMIREDCAEIAEKFADPRRTIIEDGDADDFEIEALIQEHDVVVTISHEGYVKRLPVDTYRSQGRGGTGIRGSQTKEDDFVERVFVSTTHTDLMCFTNTGRVFRMKVWQIPEMSRTSRGRPIQNLIELRKGETVRFFLPVSDFEKSEDYLFFATASGKVKRTTLKDYRTSTAAASSPSS